MDLPLIDPRVRHVGVSKLREFDIEKLRTMGDVAYVIRDNDQPLAVLLPFETFMAMQADLEWAAKFADEKPEPDEIERLKNASIQLQRLQADLRNDALREQQTVLIHAFRCGWNAAGKTEQDFTNEYERWLVRMRRSGSYPEDRVSAQFQAAKQADPAQPPGVEA